MTEAPLAPKFEQPPSVITDKPLKLDDVTFVPRAGGIMEACLRGEQHIGDVLMDRVQQKPEDEPTIRWLARKIINNEMSDWKQMRCVHEARAFIVSRIRQ